MYVARFSYDVLSINRQRAIEFIWRELTAAQKRQLNARLLIPVTRGHHAAALQFEVQLNSLDQLDRFRTEGIALFGCTGSDEFRRQSRHGDAIEVAPVAASPSLQERQGGGS